MRAGIGNAVRNYAKSLSLVCPLLAILTLSGMYFLAAEPLRDIDFLYLYIALVFAAAFPLLGLKAAIMLRSNSNPKDVQRLGASMIAANILLLCVDAVFCIIVGLVGTTGSY